MELCGCWCGKCDHENLLGVVEQKLSGEYMGDISKLHLGFCPHCGEEIEFESNDQYYMGRIHLIPFHLDKALASLEDAKWFLNYGYVTSRLEICNIAAIEMAKELSNGDMRYVYSMSKVCDAIYKLESLLIEYDYHRGDQEREDEDVSLELKEEWVDTLKKYIGG